MSHNRREFVRYGVTVALGLVVDLAAARGAVSLGAPLELAAALGVACGAAFNYVLLELWAFSGPKTVAATARPLHYLGALGVTMGVRAAAVWVLEAALPADTRAMLILGAAVVVSFAANFLLSKHWVFRRSDIPLATSGE